MNRVTSFIQHHRGIILAFVGIIALEVIIELLMGRSFFGPDGQFGWWSGDIWSNTNSQRVADAYSFSHIIHGIAFFAILSLIAKNIPLRYRFLIAVILEAAWEILENSPLIINRYREVTVSLGYEGDSILNSCSDIIMMSIGFFFASRARIWVTVTLVVAMEIGCLFWIRDNLTLNIIMLLHPIDAIKAWQMAGHVISS